MNISGRYLSIEMAIKGFTLVQLAEKSGVSRATLSAVKNGKSCSYDTAVKIAKALGVDVNEIIMRV